MSGTWHIERRVATAAELHREWPAPESRGRRRAALCTVTGPRTLVVGSTQAAGRELPEFVDAVAVVRRGSGGGAVVVAPGAQVWVELWLPRGDPLWDDDVVRSGEWVGDAWQAALTEIGVGEPIAVHRGATVFRPWAASVCFAGLGPGEVTVAGRKVVGLAQRRGRAGARFQTTVPLTWDGACVVDALVATGLLGDADANEVAASVAVQAVGLADVADAGGRLLAAAEDALVSSLAHVGSS